MSDDFNHFQYNNTRIEYRCPAGTSDDDQWTNIEYDDDGLNLGAKMAAGPSCTASLTFTGSGAMVGGARGAFFNAWGCSIDGGETFTWYKDVDPPTTTFRIICNFMGMEDKEHTLVVSNSPDGKSGLRVSSFSVTTGGTALGTTLSLVNISTMAEPEPASTTSSETITTSSSPAFSSSSAVILKSAGTTLAETNSQSTSVSTSVSSANSDTLNGNLTAS